MDERVEGETAAPAGGEVLHVDATVAGGGLATPGEQRLLQARLLQVSHHFFQYTLYLVYHQTSDVISHQHRHKIISLPMISTNVDPVSPAAGANRELLATICAVYVKAAGRQFVLTSHAT